MSELIKTKSLKVDDCHEAVGRLEEIIDTCKGLQSPIGYFASLYRLTTITIVRAIDNGKFEDNERMARMDKNFANRYFAAVESWLDGMQPTRAWEMAFIASEMDNLSVFQHLFLGMNAHINLDLWLAAAETCPGDSIHDFENDFNKINKILESLMDITEHDIAKVWHPLKILLHMGEKAGNLIASFEMESYRKSAWDNAVKYALSDAEGQKNMMKEHDMNVVHLGLSIVKPEKLIGSFLSGIKSHEKGTVAEKIEDFHNQI